MPVSSLGDGESELDLVIIGAGIHGAGVAQAAAARGYRALVVEKSGVAAGTSSRSSKLIHGGLRYLETGQLGLVRESLHERELLARLAPDLVHWVPFYVPVYRGSRRAAWKIRTGLSLYAMLAGFRRHAVFTSVPRREWTALDGLRTDDLTAVFRYWDAQTDDAELTRAVMHSAVGIGGGGVELRAPAELVSAERTASGCRVRIRNDAGTEEEHACRVLVNAAGPWLNEVAARIVPAGARVPVELVQGSHLVLAGTLDHGIYYVEAPADRRAVFIMPWHEKLLVGTTETRFSGDPGLVRVLPEEEKYLLETFACYFPGRPVTVLDRFAGVRVLPAGNDTPNARRRETRIVVDDERAPRVVTIAGGKLTGYRATAAKVMQHIAPALPPPRRTPLDTAQIPLARAPALTTSRTRSSH